MKKKRTDEYTNKSHFFDYCTVHTVRGLRSVYNVYTLQCLQCTVRKCSDNFNLVVGADFDDSWALALGADEEVACQEHLRVRLLRKKDWTERRCILYTLYIVSYTILHKINKIIKIEKNHIYYAPPELNQVEVAQAQFKNSFHLLLMRKKIHRNI